MASFPLVSIIAVCFNQDKWVAQTLDSITKQTYSNIQLIIADDGSTDNSKNIIDAWVKENNSNAIFINHPKNLGLTKNINSGLIYVKGEYFQAFGCDDIMLPHKIENQVKAMEADKNIGIIYSDMDLIDADGTKFSQTYYQRDKNKKPRSGNLYTDLIDRFFISAPTVLIRKKVLDKLKGYNEKLDYEDHDFFLRTAKTFDFLYVPEITVQYRISAQSMTRTNTSLKFFKNSFAIFCDNFDSDKKYSPLFVAKLLFYTKNLYSLKFRDAANYFFKAFLKTKKFIFLKYSIASISFYFQKEKTK
jgi:glycosyltransferase involved in cell wall biosynthesis